MAGFQSDRQTDRQREREREREREITFYANKFPLPFSPRRHCQMMPTKETFSSGIWGPYKSNTPITPRHEWPEGPRTGTRLPCRANVRLTARTEIIILNKGVCLSDDTW